MIVETRYAHRGNASIAYQTIGQGDIDIVLVPCWISHLERLWKEPRFARFIERLAQFGRVILFDKRGTGLSDPMPATQFPSLEERMEDLEMVLDTTGSRRTVLFGTAIGGRLALLFAAAHPERVLSLITFGVGARGSWAPDYPWAPTAEEHEQRFAHLLREWGGPVMVEAYAASAAHDPEFRRWWAECLRSGASPTTAVAAERLSAETDVRHALPKIQAPTLAFHRTGDRLVDLAAGRHLAARIPNARFVELPGSDHLPFVGDQDGLFTAIERFLGDTLGMQPRTQTDRGLATVVVADFIGAAETAARLGEERWQAIRSSLRSSIRETLARYGGREVSATPNGLVATFVAPAQAARFASSFAEEVRRLGLHARIGLHTGEFEIGGGDVGGRAVHLAVRIAAQARQDETLVSETVVELVMGSGLAFSPLDDREPVNLPVDLRLFRLVDSSSSTTMRPAVTEALRTIVHAPILPLSPREREVTSLVALGRSNREIGDELAISKATVERHVANIMTKLGVRSRTQIAAWSATQTWRREHAPVAGIGRGRTDLQPVALAGD